MKNVAIDSDVFVASEIKTESNHKESKEFVDYILSKQIKNVFFFTSLFTLLELGSAMIRRTKNKDKTYSLLYRITRSWKNVINPLPLSSSKKQITPTVFSRDLIDNLIETSIKFNTKSGDTIQSQAILENQIDCFVTWNKKDFIILEKAIPNFEVLTPKEFLTKIKSIDGECKGYDGLLNLIFEKSNMSKKDIEERIEAKRKKLSGLVSKMGAAQIIAAELGINF